MPQTLLASAEETPHQAALLLPLLGSTLLTGITVALVCEPPANPLPAPALALLAASYLLLAALAHAAAVWLVQRLFHDTLDYPLEALIVGLWSTIAWLPLLTLLTARNSLWVAATIPLIINSATHLLRNPSDEDAANTTPLSKLDRPLYRALLPSLVASIALEGGALALAFEHAWLAGLCFAAFIVLPASHLLPPATPLATQPRALARRHALRLSWAAWLLTTAALLPFARSGPLADTLAHLARITPHVTRPLRVTRTPTGTGKGDLQFVVLLPPAQPDEKRLAVAPESVGGPPTGTRRLVIPFDGPYWFFKHAGDQPGSHARHERGDPGQVNIRSTDGLPLLMEAHQTFVPPLSLAAVHSLEVNLANIDDRPGTIAVEVILQGQIRQQTASISLGSLVLPSSRDPDPRLGRPPIPDKLSFHLPAAAHNLQVDTLILRLQPSPSRALAAPRVSIKNFVLNP